MLLLSQRLGRPANFLGENSEDKARIMLKMTTARPSNFCSAGDAHYFAPGFTLGELKAQEGCKHRPGRDPQTPLWGVLGVLAGCQSTQHQRLLRQLRQQLLSHWLRRQLLCGSSHLLGALHVGKTACVCPAVGRETIKFVSCRRGKYTLVERTHNQDTALCIHGMIANEHNVQTLRATAAAGDESPAVLATVPPPRKGLSRGPWAESGEYCRRGE